MEFTIISADPGIAPGSTKGAALHLRGLATALERAGHRVLTFSRRPAEGEHPGSVLPLESLATVRRGSVVYERYSLGHIGGLLQARAWGVPFVLEVNAPLLDEATRHRPGTVDVGDAAAEAQLLADADLVIAVSNPLAEWVRRRRKGPVEVIANGFEPAWFNGPGPVVTHDLVFLGHPKPWHGADRIPALMAGLADRGHAVQTLVVGGGPGADALTAIARDFGVHRRLTVTGALAPESASMAVRKGKIAIAPYPPADPFYFCPLKVIDYMAAGLPVVASDLGDIGDLVGGAGVVVPADDDVRWLDAIEGLLSQPQRRAALAVEGRRRAHANYTWDAVANRTVDAIRRVVDGVSVR